MSETGGKGEHVLLMRVWALDALNASPTLTNAVAAKSAVASLPQLPVI